MKQQIIALLSFMLFTVTSFAQTANSTTYTKDEQELVNLSKDKWQWMADKNVDKLAPLFHDESKFVHMSGTWK